MSQLATRPPAAAVGHATAREFPSTAPRGFLEDRTSAWRSRPCAAGAHRFDVSTESTAGLLDRLEAVTIPLSSGSAHGALVHYRILWRHHEHIPYALYLDRERLLLARSPEPLIQFLTWHVNQSMIAGTTRDQVVLHAAAATRAGITVVLPGDQERGKTTTVAGLLREGYDYVTDEATVIDPGTLWISPFPKALSIDEGAWPLFPECRSLIEDGIHQFQVRAEVLGSRSLHRPVPPARLILFPRYTAGVRTHALPISAGEAVRELVSTTFHFADNPRRNLAVLGTVVRGATLARLQIGDLDEAVRLVDRLLSESVMKGLTQ